MSWTNNISRDPETYSPTVHAVQQHKYRKIDWELVAETIKNGRIKDSHKDDCCLFIHDPGFTDDPVGVVANYESGEILTVEWRRE